MGYVFMSFGSYDTSKNIGCCIVNVSNGNDANDECERLGLIPQENNQARGYELTDESFEEQGMKLNKFYSAADMERMGFKRG